MPLKGKRGKRGNLCFWLLLAKAKGEAREATFAFAYARWHRPEGLLLAKATGEARDATEA